MTIGRRKSNKRLSLMNQRGVAICRACGAIEALQKSLDALLEVKVVLHSPGCNSIRGLSLEMINVE